MKGCGPPDFDCKTFWFNACIHFHVLVADGVVFGGESWGFVLFFYLWRYLICFLKSEVNLRKYT